MDGIKDGIKARVGQTFMYRRSEKSLPIMGRILEIETYPDGEIETYPDEEIETYPDGEIETYPDGEIVFTGTIQYHPCRRSPKEIPEEYPEFQRDANPPRWIFHFSPGFVKFGVTLFERETALRMAISQNFRSFGRRFLVTDQHTTVQGSWFVNVVVKNVCTENRLYQESEYLFTDTCESLERTEEVEMPKIGDVVYAADWRLCMGHYKGSWFRADTKTDNFIVFLNEIIDDKDYIKGRSPQEIIESVSEPNTYRRSIAEAVLLNVIDDNNYRIFTETSLWRYLPFN